MLCGGHIRDAAMADQDRLGLTGGARGVDEVGGLVDIDGAAALFVGDGCVGDEHDPSDRVQVVEQQPVDGAGQCLTGRRDGHSDRCLRIGQHVFDPLHRIARIQREEGRTGLGERPDGHHGFQ